MINIFLVCLGLVFLNADTRFETVHFSHENVSTHAYSFLGGRYDNGYPEHKYHKVLDMVQKVYEPIVKAQGGSFHILRDWTDGAVNMWAFRVSQEYWLEVPGGMSRYHLISEEAFILTICHELGHLLGGEPKRGEISFEGQADYFATQGCVQRLMLEVTPYKDLPVDLDVERLCRNKDLKELCARVLKGALSLTSYYAELENTQAPSYTQKDDTEVHQTLETHPPAQCRLDSLYAGYIGAKRPACWYKN